MPWVHNNGTTGVTLETLTNNEDSNGAELPCINVTNSCLAEGTMIEMAGSEPVAIEGIEMGAIASNPFTARGLTVLDIAKGTEDVPMVRMEDEAGRTLLLTVKHPILVVGRLF